MARPYSKLQSIGPTREKVVKTKKVYQLKRTRLKQKAKRPTGELALFEEIWKERAHKSEVSGEPLVPKGHMLWINQFSHVLPKGLYKVFRLDKRNVLLKTSHEHHMWGTQTDKLKGLPEWQWVFQLAEALRIEANNK